MDMSAAAIPPRQPPITEADRAHPLFRLYDEHRRFCARKMIEASAFSDWLYQHEAEAVSDNAARHPRFPEFQTWMRANQGGARKCPAGVFPENFRFWIEGGRW